MSVYSCQCPKDISSLSLALVVPPLCATISGPVADSHLKLRLPDGAAMLADCSGDN